MIYVLNRSMISIRKIFLIAVVLAFVGCATPTKPNIPFSGSIPGLDKIAQRNLLLATELRKLPEIQEGISPLGLSALEKIVELYYRFPDKFDNAFEQMYKVGLPNVRKYCSPLQAMFWLAEDEKISSCNQVINKYDLKTLLRIGWPAEESRKINSKIEEADKLEGMCIDQELKEEIFPYVLPEEVINEAIKYPEKFGMKEYNGLGVDEQFKKHKKRWGKIEDVVDRLNDPGLIDYYINNNISYKLTSTSAKQTPKGTFKYREGSCSSLAKFGNYALKRSGFKTRYRRVDWFDGGHTGLIVVLDDGRYLVAVDFSSIGNQMGGPYKSIFEVDVQLSFGKKISNRYWGLPEYAW